MHGHWVWVHKRCSAKAASQCMRAISAIRKSGSSAGCRNLQVLVGCCSAQSRDAPWIAHTPSLTDCVGTCGPAQPLTESICNPSCTASASIAGSKGLDAPPFEWGSLVRARTLCSAPARCKVEPKSRLQAVFRRVRAQPLLQHHQHPDHGPVVLRRRGQVVVQQSLGKFRLDEAAG